MTGQLSSPDENYDRRHDLYHRRATFRNIRELDLTTLPVLIRYGAALFFQLSACVPVNLTPCLWQRPSRRATGTVRSSRQTKILSANGDVYMLTAPGLQSLNRQVLRRQGNCRDIMPSALLNAIARAWRHGQHASAGLADHAVLNPGPA